MFSKCHEYPSMFPPKKKCEMDRFGRRCPERLKLKGRTPTADSFILLLGRTRHLEQVSPYIQDFLTLWQHVQDKWSELVAKKKGNRENQKISFEASGFEPSNAESTKRNAASGVSPRLKVAFCVILKFHKENSVKGSPTSKGPSWREKIWGLWNFVKLALQPFGPVWKILKIVSSPEKSDAKLCHTLGSWLRLHLLALRSYQCFLDTPNRTRTRTSWTSTFVWTSKCAPQPIRIILHHSLHISMSISCTQVVHRSTCALAAFLQGV